MTFMQIETKKIRDHWTLYTLSNDQDVQVSFLDYGGIITKLLVPDKDGNLENIVLGYKNYEEYELNPNYFGAIIGRVAGRIANSSFTLDGKTYQLTANENNHHLHGGPNGAHQVIWQAETFQHPDSVGAILTHTFKEEDDGYPGNVAVRVTYTLTNNNEFLIDYEATTDQTTVLTLTNHSYFNLSGDLKNTIHDHIVRMNSKRFVELDEELIPTGNILDVVGTPFDFRNGRKLLEGLEATHQQNQIVGDGYDHYFMFEDIQEGQITVEEPASGRILKITSNQPGVVMYTSNGLDDSLHLQEGKSRKYLGVCFETQGSPASLVYPSFPSIRLETNQTYQKQTKFSFEVKA